MIQQDLALIIVAAGTSTRMSGIDKVWADLGGYPVIWHSVAALAPLAAWTALVVHSDHLRDGDKILHHFRKSTQHLECRLQTVQGGRNRQESVALGLASIPDEARVIAVHDGARPLVREEILRRGYGALRDADGAVPVMPVVDTVKRVDAGGWVIATVPRDELRGAQTPQVFGASALRSAHLAAAQRPHGATDDAELLEASGYRVRVFDGSRENFKITTEHDLLLARLLVDGPRQ